MRLKRFSPVVIGIGITVILSLGGAASAGPLYDRGIEAYDRVEYEQAAKLIARALAEESFDQPGLERAYLLYASALLGAGNQAGAQAAFATLYALDPSYQPNADVSPRVRQALSAAAADAPKRAPSIEHHPPPAPPGNQSAVIEAQVEASPLLGPVIEFRVGTTAPTVVPMSCVGDRCQARLPAAQQRLTYRLAFKTGEGALALPTQVFELGLPLVGGAVVGSSPVVHRHVPLQRRWWLWTAVGAGALLVAGAITAGVLVHDSQTSLGLSLTKQCSGSTNQQCLMPLW